jgi:DNA (cytosine-5)-methyltransferase 1
MWDVVRFAEQKILKGSPYRAIVVENVVDAFKWGADDDGQLFAAWRQAMTGLGYKSQIVYLNSMFAPPTPQSRDRMYVVFWQKGIKPPNLNISPPSWCPTCEELVDGQQVWKKPENPWGRYGAQYLYACPNCQGFALPGVFPAASAIDWEIPAERIGDRDRPLAQNTRDRIKRGLERLASEPFAIRLLQGGTPKPLTLPFVTLTQRHDLAMVLPVAGNTFERTPGNRARDATTSPMDTIHGTLDRAVVMVQRNGRVLHPAEPAHTMRAGGFHHGVVMRNNNHRGDPGSMVTSDLEPIRAMTTHCHQSLVIPYQSIPHRADEPCKTITTRDRLALLVPPEPPKTPPPPRELNDKDIDDCSFRMFQLPEIARTMTMDNHPNGGDYIVTGNKRERMAQYGNAVTPPAMQLLVSRLAETLAA